VSAKTSVVSGFHIVRAFSVTVLRHLLFTLPPRKRRARGSSILVMALLASSLILLPASSEAQSYSNPVVAQSYAASESGPATTTYDRGPGDNVELVENQYDTAIDPGNVDSHLPTPTGTPFDPAMRYLEPGFPVQALESAGRYYGQQAMQTTVGNIDGDPTLEIVVTGVANGPLYAWNADGSPQEGWPDSLQFSGYPTLGNLSSSHPGLEIFALRYGGYDRSMQAMAYSGSGTMLPGWPLQTPNLGPLSALADVDGDGIDEIFVQGLDGKMYAFKADGTELEGWPVYDPNRYTDERFSAPAIGDLDGDGSLEIVALAEHNYEGSYLFVIRADGSLLDGMPVHLPTATKARYPKIGNVDGEGNSEIIVQETLDSILVLSSDGTLKQRLQLASEAPIQQSPALADIDGDGVPEIIVQSYAAVNVLKADGTSLPGWPWVADPRDFDASVSSPVVGDVDGDGYQDIVVVFGYNCCVSGIPYVLNRFGSVLPILDSLRVGYGAVPAIADIDLDGHNEVIITSDAWGGEESYQDKVWAFDVRAEGPYGHIEWGQYAGGPRHQGVYTPFVCDIFIDVPEGSTFFPYVECLTSRGVISGYDNCSFRPNDKVTRGQIAKIVANSMGFDEEVPSGRQTYADVAPASPFWEYIERLARRAVIAGYECGGPGEPCDSNERPYYRPAINVTRGQSSKIIANAAGFNEVVPEGQRSYTDVPPSGLGSTFWPYIERLSSRRVMGGYACGGATEECDDQYRPYFRSNADVTRGQAAKIASNTFFPNCQTPAGK
jgi:hypothetical protein